MGELARVGDDPDSASDWGGGPVGPLPGRCSNCHRVVYWRDGSWQDRVDNVWRAHVCGRKATHAGPKPEPIGYQATFVLVLHAVEQVFMVERADLLGRSLRQEVTEARHVVMYLLHDRAGWGPVHIGRRLGRDHSTVIQGVAAVRLRGGFPEYARLLDAIAADAGLSDAKLGGLHLPAAGVE